ncbi:hypothetical protein FN846DRAFT_526119 [Sphaerosporella brunnea]|uniref:Uncharacterized protein n=1 Tax=Sphaerosporella brunnea TaxID=1250544 RepID=A0A5J5F4A6_9PEZI|nr:hypothetical protein FN846DRAFT_526119 [Sphaerosporella brunnea]
MDGIDEVEFVLFFTFSFFSFSDGEEDFMGCFFVTLMQLFFFLPTLYLCTYLYIYYLLSSPYVLLFLPIFHFSPRFADTCTHIYFISVVVTMVVVVVVFVFRSY